MKNQKLLITDYRLPITDKLRRCAAASLRYIIFLSIFTENVINEN